MSNFISLFFLVLTTSIFAETDQYNAELEKLKKMNEKVDVTLPSILYQDLPDEERQLIGKLAAEDEVDSLLAEAESEIKKMEEESAQDQISTKAAAVSRSPAFPTESGASEDLLEAANLDELEQELDFYRKLPAVVPAQNKKKPMRLAR